MENMQQRELYQEEVIDLRDVWRKLVEYKKVFWGILSAIFIIGSVFICLMPPKYNFTQVIALAKSPDEKGENALRLTTKDCASKIQKIFIDNAIKAYNSKNNNKIYANSTKISIQEIGDDFLMLSVHGTLKKQYVYKFIFDYIIKELIDRHSDAFEYRMSSLNETKANLEQRLQEINDFYHNYTKEYSAASEQESKNKVFIMENKIVGMYFNDQNLAMNALMKDIASLKAQIVNTHNFKAVTNLTVSDQPIGPSKIVLIILAAFAALFFAFFGVFIANFLFNLNRSREA